jgi:DNA-binding transcriptional LysR family regulator
LERFEDLWRTPGSDQQASLSGTVRITAPHSLGTRAVLPALERVAARHPGITLDVRLSDRISNTVDEGIDVGIRVGFMRDSRFVARKAADMRLPIVAAPRLIKKVGVPENIDALSSLPVTVALDINTGRPWPWHFKAGRQWTPTAPTLVADNADMEMGAALAGIAFAQLADYMAAPYIASGKLVRVLENEEPPAWGCTSIGLSVAPFREGFERYLMKCWSPLDRCQLCADTSQDAVGHTPWKAGH